MLNFTICETVFKNCIDEAVAASCPEWLVVYWEDLSYSVIYEMPRSVQEKNST
jgi:hypothetical protein